MRLADHSHKFNYSDTDQEKEASNNIEVKESIFCYE